jgi:hypothetical protein
MSYKPVQWAVCIGFDGEHLAEIKPEVERLKKKYPQQEFRIYNSKFPQYTFLLVTFAEDRDKAHQIGLALVKKELPQHLNLLYWCKEIKSLADVITRPPRPP